MINNLRCLIFSNPLIRDPNTGLYLYEKDSGFIYTKHLISELPSNYRFTWIIPEQTYKDENWGNWKWFTEANENVTVIPYPFGSSILYNRYYFDGNALHRQIGADEDIDIIINNQPELSAALKVWAVYRNTHPVIMSFFHWMDCKASREFSAEFAGYFWREYEAYLQSDVSLFHNEYSWSMFKQEIIDHIKDEPDKKIAYFHPPPTDFGTEPMDLPDKKIILFNHRLNRTTNFKEVIDIMDQIYQIRQDFVLWLTDEKQDVNVGDSVNKPYIIRKTVPSSQYGTLIGRSHFAVCNHKGYSTWNMAILDSLYNGAFTLIPYDGVYKEMFGEAGLEHGIYHHFTDLKDKILHCLDFEIEPLKRMAMEVCGAAPAFKHGDDIASIMEECINRKIPSETYKGFEDVKRLIENKHICTKEEWVDKFWTGNRNSNFLRIRWLLLKSGIKDDTSSKKTTYISDKEPTEVLMNVQRPLFL